MAKDSGGSGDTVILGQSYLERPKSLLDAIKEIQNTAAMEMSTTEGINPAFFSLKDRIDLMVVGIKNSFVSGIILALLTPFAIGVVERSIPIFGETDPSLFDQFYALLLALGFSIGYGFFLASLRHYYVGNMSKTMIRNLLGGIILGSFLKTVLVLIIFHFIYLFFTPERVASMLITFNKAMSYEKLEKIYVWIVNFRPNFLTASWLVVVSTVLFVAIPLCSIAYTTYRERKQEV